MKTTLALLITLAPLSFAGARTIIHVPNPPSILTIQDGLNAANPGDLVLVDDAIVYSPSTNGEVFPINLATQVDVFGSGNVIIDAEGTGDVICAGGSIQDVVLLNLTLRNGNAGLLLDDSSNHLSVWSCRFESNGIGIWTNEYAVGAIDIDDCTINDGMFIACPAFEIEMRNSHVTGGIELQWVYSWVQLVAQDCIIENGINIE